MITHDKFRRRFFSVLGLAGVALGTNKAQAHHTDTHFDDESAHKIVYQCNKADDEYFGHVLFSVGEMIRKYGDDIEVIVAAFGPGIQLLGKNPTRKFDLKYQKTARSLAQFGVSFHACGNTMDSLNWTEKDLLSIAKMVPIGVDDIMQLQEKGFSYISI